MSGKSENARRTRKERCSREGEKKKAKREKKKYRERGTRVRVYTEETGGRSVVREGSALGSWNVE